MMTKQDDSGSRMSATKVPGRSNAPTAQGKIRPRSRVAFRRVLAPIDFSKPSRAALRYASDFATMHDSELTLLHVVEPLLSVAEIGYPTLPVAPLPSGYKGQMKARLEKLKAEELRPGMKVDLQVRVGRPYAEIARAAKEHNVDLIIMATHGYTGLKHVLLGSTAERVVRHAPCPVLTVRERTRS